MWCKKNNRYSLCHPGGKENKEFAAKLTGVKIAFLIAKF